VSKTGKKPFGLEQHVKRVTFQAGHFWDHLSVLPSPSRWGWIKTDGEPHWTAHFQKHPRPSMNWSLIAAREGVVAAASAKRLHSCPLLFQ